MVLSRLLFPIIISLLVIQRGQSQCNCPKNNMFKSLQGSSLQFTKNNLQTFEKFNELFNKARKNVPEAQSLSSTLQQPALEQHSRNIIQQTPEYQIPISSISIGNGNQAKKPRPGPNCFQNSNKPCGVEFNFINRSPCEPCSTQNSQKMDNGLIPVTISFPPNVLDMTNQLGSGSYFIPSSALANIFPQNYVQNPTPNLENTVMMQPPVFNPATQTAQSPAPIVYLIQAPNTPQYNSPVACPTAASTSKSTDLQSLIPILLNLLNDKKCGSGCPNCQNFGCRHKENPIIHSGYAKKNINGKVDDESKLEGPEVKEEKNDDENEEDKNTAKDEDIESGEYDDNDDPDFRDESKEE